MIKKLIVLIVVGCIVAIIWGGVPPECEGKIIGGCFKPKDPGEPDTPEDREIRDILYDATVEFLKEQDVKGGGGKGLKEVACEIAVQLMCFASGVESIDAPDVRRKLGIPPKIWRQMLKKNPFIARRLLAGILQAAQAGVDQIDLNTPQIKRAFADIRRLWKKGGKGGAGGSGGGATQISRGSTTSSIPRGGNFVRRPPSVFRNPASLQGQTPGAQPSQTPSNPAEEEILPTPPPTQQGVLQPPTAQPTAAQPTGTPGQGGDGLNICIFCVPQKANPQQQQQQSGQQQSQSQGQSQNQPSGQQNGCTCLVDDNTASSSSDDKRLLKSVLARIDGKLSRTQSTPPNDITLDEFRNGLNALINQATTGVDAIENMSIIDTDTSLGIGGTNVSIRDQLWLRYDKCPLRSNPNDNKGYSDKECVADRIGDINTDIDICPYIVLKNLRMCFDPSKRTTDLSQLEYTSLDNVIKKVLENDDSLYKRLKRAHNNMKAFITGCSTAVTQVANEILRKVNGSEDSTCAAAPPSIKEQISKNIQALQVLLRSVLPRPNSAPGTCHAPPGSPILPRNLHAAILDGLNKYKVLPAFTPLKVLIPADEFNRCQTESGNNVYSMLESQITLKSTLGEVFKEVLKTEISKALDIFKDVSGFKCLDLGKSSTLESFLEACQSANFLRTPVCVAAGYKRWDPAHPVPLYLYPVEQGQDKPNPDVVKYCSYIQSDWAKPGFGSNIFTFANYGKNLLLCMIYNAIAEGNNNSIPSAEENSDFTKLLLAHGCRKGIQDDLRYSVESPAAPPQCDDVGQNMEGGVKFVKGGAYNTDRSALTLAEILDVAYYKKADQNNAILSALTGMNGGTLWQYCNEPSDANLYNAIKMLFKFWAMLATLSDTPKLIKEYANALLSPLLGGASLPNNISDIVNLDNTKPPLNVIASGTTELKPLFEIIWNLIHVDKDGKKSKFMEMYMMINDDIKSITLVKEGSDNGLKYEKNAQEGQQPSVKYSPSSVKDCVFEFSKSPGATAGELVVKDGCGNKGSDLYNKAEGIARRTIQTFILYYMIGAPYLFSRNNNFGFDLTATNLEKNLILGSSSFNHINFPFRSSQAWGLWKLPFLIYEEKQGGWGEQWKKIVHASLENWLLNDMISKIRALQQQQGSDDITYTLGMQGDGSQIKVTVKLNLQEPLYSPTINKIESGLSGSCLQAIFTPYCTDGKGLIGVHGKDKDKDILASIKAWVDVKPQTQQGTPPGAAPQQQGQTNITVRWDPNSAPSICQYLIPDLKAEGGNQEDIIKQTWATVCWNLISRILILIAINNTIYQHEKYRKPEKTLGIISMEVLVEPLFNQLPSVFGFYQKVENEKQVISQIISKEVDKFVKDVFNENTQWDIDLQNAGKLIANILKFVTRFAEGALFKKAGQGVDSDFVKSLGNAAPNSLLPLVASGASGATGQPGTGNISEVVAISTAVSHDSVGRGCLGGGGNVANKAIELFKREIQEFKEKKDEDINGEICGLLGGK